MLLQPAPQRPAARMLSSLLSICCCSQPHKDCQERLIPSCFLSSAIHIEEISGVLCLCALFNVVIVWVFCWANGQTTIVMTECLCYHVKSVSYFRKLFRRTATCIDYEWPVYVFLLSVFSAENIYATALWDISRYYRCCLFPSIELSFPAMSCELLSSCNLAIATILLEYPSTLQFFGCMQCLIDGS